MQNSPGVRCALGAVEVGEDFPSPSAGTELGSWTARLGSARAGAVGHCRLPTCHRAWGFGANGEDGDVLEN